jgi:translation initiation factor 1
MKSGRDAAGGGLVYSTASGSMCPACRRALGECTCGRRKPATGGDSVARVARETKGRNGKSVTVIRGLALDDAALTALGRQLRAACGSGGTVKAGVIEVQGDHCERVIEALARQGFKARRTGA